MFFTAMAVVGYAVYAAAPTWPLVFVGLFGVMGWKAGAFPTTFAVIGDSLPRDRRATAFGVQSVLVRVPRVIGAPVGGFLIAALSMAAGIRVSFAATIVLGVAVLAVQYRFFAGDRDSTRSNATGRGAAHMPGALRQLLLSDCLVRIGEGVAASFIVLFVTQVRGVSVARFGVLYALQQAVAILSYVPGGRLADLRGRSPVVVLTFFFFAAFPLAVWLARTDAALIAAFVVGGLKEIGEPARKSMIVDLAPDERRARVVGVYYTIRNLVVVPAGLVGGILWQQEQDLPLVTASVVSAIGLVTYLMTSVRRTDPRKLTSAP
jgi:predicted MFS family arabinose efflux permease